MNWEFYFHFIELEESNFVGKLNLCACLYVIIGGEYVSLYTRNCVYTMFERETLLRNSKILNNFCVPVLYLFLYKICEAFYNAWQVQDSPICSIIVAIDFRSYLLTYLF